jgi:hypothetical protein
MTDAVADAARAAWKLAETVDQLTPADLSDPALDSVLEHIWALADHFEEKVEQARAISGSRE